MRSVITSGLNLAFISSVLVNGLGEFKVKTESEKKLIHYHLEEIIWIQKKNYNN